MKLIARCCAIKETVEHADRRGERVPVRAEVTFCGISFNSDLVIMFTDPREIAELELGATYEFELHTLGG